MAKAIPLDRPNVSLIKPENIAPDIIEEEIQKFTKAYDDEVKILEENKKKFAQTDRQAVFSLSQYRCLPVSMH